MFKREILNQNRTLTMSNNRKCDYLILHVYERNITLMGIKSSLNVDDIVFIKQYKNSVIGGIIKEIADICYEFEITTVLTVRYKALSMPEMTRDMLEYYIPKVNCIEVDLQYHQKTLFDIKNKIDNSQIRFLQSPETAVNSYKKPFLGYTNVMGYHCETTLLIDELCDVKLIQNKVGDYYNEKEDCLRLECLEIYYYYINNQIKKENQNKKFQLECIKKNITREIQKKIFLKYIFKAVENENIKIMFFLKNAHQFKNDIKKYIPEIEGLLHIKIKSTIGAILCNLDFENGSRIAIVEDINLRGIKTDYAIIDKGLFYDGEYRDIIGLTLHNSKVENNIDFLDMED